MCRTPAVRWNVARSRFGLVTGNQPLPGRGIRFNGPNSSMQITRPSAGAWS
jgi:hypothetical protein